MVEAVGGDLIARAMARASHVPFASHPTYPNPPHHLGQMPPARTERSTSAPIDPGRPHPGLAKPSWRGDAGAPRGGQGPQARPIGQTPGVRLPVVPSQPDIGYPRAAQARPAGDDSPRRQAPQSARRYGAMHAAVFGDERRAQDARKSRQARHGNGVASAPHPPRWHPEWRGVRQAQVVPGKRWNVAAAHRGERSVRYGFARRLRRVGRAAPAGLRGGLGSQGTGWLPRLRR